ncbi:hypothetical protein [Mitsuaria sp. GD03876]|uniref:hypothetical protein n=1 Tax=Mitsuaria sp. GD03876 TaxID=2975399 RepID=UPI00244C3F28|nr:hypothetical protein [Mitsuaria sp. GD03876]MDH0865781.1 hypothetical protein [Mitsuaria sp. GD03876]
MPTLTSPAYIRQSGAADQAIGYEWRGTADFNKENEKLAKQLVTMSARACLAFAAGLAEWVVWRLEGRSDFGAPLQMIEAAWVAQLDARYVKIPTEYEFAERSGPVDGVLLATKDLLESALRSYNTPSAKNLFGKTVYLYQLARHVVPDTKPFDVWVKASIARLNAIYPRVDTDVKGEPVPREAVDTTAEFGKEAAPEQLSAFLRGIEPASNRYLRTPEELVAAGFAGTPYQLG